ncbi:MAG: chromate transporter [Ruminococcus sp.]|nr:chromate transporter [Candidatus Copronaster equi]
MIYLKLFLTFLKIGAFTFGGGYAMLPLIQSEVLAHHWLTEEEIINFIAVSESTPGPFAVNISTYVGMKTAGLLGAFSSTLGVVLPSFVIILIVSTVYLKFKKSKTVKGLMSGLKPAVIGLIGSAVISVGATVFFPDGVIATQFTEFSFWFSLVLFLVMTVLAFKKVHPIILIVSSAVIGIGAGYLMNL